MVRLKGHRATVAIEGDGDGAVCNEGGNPTLDREGEAKLSQGILEMGMSHIVKEALNVTGEHRVNLSPRPRRLDFLDECRAGIEYGGTLSSPKLVVGKEVEAIGVVL